MRPTNNTFSLVSFLAQYTYRILTRHPQKLHLVAHSGNALPIFQQHLQFKLPPFLHHRLIRTRTQNVVSMPPVRPKRITEHLAMRSANLLHMVLDWDNPKLRAVVSSLHLGWQQKISLLDNNHKEATTVASLPVSQIMRAVLRMEASK
jgi:hypothetical protein